MSYVQFLAVFLVLPLICGLGLTRRIMPAWILIVLGVVSVVALLYTAPWDNWIVIHGVWSYGPHQVLGVVIGHVPLEEYLFYVLQVFLTGTWTAAVLWKIGR